LALLWQTLKDEGISDEEKYQLVVEWDKIFGLKLDELEEKTEILQEVLELVEERERLRKKKQWQKADEIREQILKMGYKIEDTPTGPIVKPSK
jgi:cysteinyl-tRNA synthetase